jgi:hypothetical protein
MEDSAPNHFVLSNQINFLQIVLNLTVASSVQSTDLPEPARRCARVELFEIGTMTCRNRATPAPTPALEARKIAHSWGLTASVGVAYDLAYLD